MSIQNIQILSRIDLITSIIGALICIVFVTYEALLNPERTSEFPWEQTIGMVICSLLCPILMYYDMDVYKRWRSGAIILIRGLFIAGTVTNYEDIPHREFRWTGFIVNVLYFSRSLVIAWGSFGWPLELKYHIPLQAIHCMLATRLAPVTCAVSESAATFASENRGKFRTLMNLLDWPFAFLSGSPLRVLNAGTGDKSACLSVNVWTVGVIGFLLPNYILLRSGSVLRNWPEFRAWIRQDGWFVIMSIIQALWCVLRVIITRYVQA